MATTNGLSQITGTEIEREVVKILSERSRLADIVEELSTLRSAKEAWRWDEEPSNAAIGKLEIKLIELRESNDKLEEILDGQKLRIWELKKESHSSRQRIQGLEFDVELIRVRVCCSLMTCGTLTKTSRMSFAGRTNCWISSISAAHRIDTSTLLPYG